MTLVSVEEHWCLILIWHQFYCLLINLFIFVQEALQNHDIVCEVEDLTLMQDIFEDEFYFQKDLELGLLVLPRLDANFGPTYVCKLRRLT